MIRLTIRKVPTDLTEGSTCGSILTIICYISVAVLVTFEFNNYMTVESRDSCFSSHLKLERIILSNSIMMIISVSILILR